MKTIFSKAILAFSLACMAGLPAQSVVRKDSLLMYCSTNEKWNGSSMQGFYSYPFKGDGSAQRMGDTVGMIAFWGAPVGNKYYLCCGTLNAEGSGYDTYYLVTMERATLEVLNKEEVTSDLVANDVAVDPVSGRIYGLFLGGSSGWVWGYVDPQTKTRTKIADYTQKYKDGEPTIDQIRSLCFSPDGQAFAVPFSGRLYKVNKETGELTTVGSSYYIFNYVESATWDHENDRVLTTYSYISSSSLCAIDTATAALTTVSSLPGAVTVIYNLYDYVTDKSPLPVSGLKAAFANGSKEGSVSFVMPTLTEDGTSLNGQVDYYVVYKGEVVASGAAAPGASVTEPVSVTSSSMAKYSVYTVNSGSESIREVAAAYAGTDNPQSPVVQAEKNGNSVALTWNAVRKGANGGYVNPGKMVYDVRRYPGGASVATGISDTTYTDQVAAPAEGEVAGYYYTVTARSEGYSSEAAASRKLMFGSITPEWTEKFSQESSLDNFTILNLSNTGNTWKWNDYRKCAMVEGDNNNAKNDWLISPPLHLQKGLSYVLTFDYNTGRSFNEKYELCLGNDNTAEAMKKTIDSGTLKYSGKPYGYSSKSVTVNVDEDGVYYLGWHAKTGVNTGTLYIDNIDLKDGLSSEVPSAPVNFTVAPDEDGRLTSKICFSIPTKTMGGKALTDNMKAIVYRDSVVVKTFDGQAPGTAISFDDPVAAAGNYTYKAVAMLGEVSSDTASVAVFVGNNQPLGASRPYSSEDVNNPGMVTVHWKPTAKDYNGRNILPETLGYKLLRIYDDGKTDTLATIMADTTYTYKECEPTETQYVVYYQLYAFNSYGMGPIVSLPSDALYVGAPYMAPYNESFKGKLKVPFATKTLYGWSREVYWAPTTDDGTYSSQDGDGCYVHMLGSSKGNSASMTSGKISLANIQQPVLSFWVYKHNSDEANQLETLIGFGGNYSSVDITTMDQVNEGWNKISIDLSDYAGKSITLRWIGTISNVTEIMMDNISVDGDVVNGIGGPAGGDIQYVHYFDLSGRRIQAPRKGELVIMKTMFSDGRLDTRKIVY